MLCQRGFLPYLQLEKERGGELVKTVMAKRRLNASIHRIHARLRAQ